MVGIFFKDYLRQFNYIGGDYDGHTVGSVIDKEVVANALKQFQDMAHIPQTGR